MDVVERAQRFADDVLFPAALATDAADVVPRELLDRLAAEGFYGVGVDGDFATVCAVQEALASGCLTTAFVWAQHLGLVHALAAGGDDDLRARWLEPLRRGDVRAGLALGGALPQPTLCARRDGEVWSLDGISPFLSGWGVIDVVHTAARTSDDETVWLIVDAVESDALQVERLRLVALDATATVRATFDALRVPADRQTARRAQLDELGPETPARRAEAGELAVRAAATLATVRGSRSVLLGDHAQRLWREALFVLIYALRPASRDALLARL
jgi:alkylation response protein AidB-like acyl-CoA dehydrogenase